MPKYQGQLEINWLHKRAGLAPGKGTEAEAEDKNSPDAPFLMVMPSLLSHTLKYRYTYQEGEQEN